MAITELGHGVLRSLLIPIPVTPSKVGPGAVGVSMSRVPGSPSRESLLGPFSWCVNLGMKPTFWLGVTSIVPRERDTKAGKSPANLQKPEVAGG